MLITFEEVVAEIDIGGSELSAWIERNWVLPVEEDGEFLFDASDIARVRLIAELRQDLGVNEEAIPVVLRLLDQVYGLQRALGEINDAIKALPADCRRRLEDILRHSSEDE